MSTYKEQIDRYAKQILSLSLGQHRWNISKAAKALGMSRQHLHNLIRKYRLERPRRKIQEVAEEPEASTVSVTVPDPFTKPTVAGGEIHAEISSDLSR